MKKTDCQFYCKGGWCGKCHDEVVEITRNYVSKRIVCVRCIAGRAKEYGMVTLSDENVAYLFPEIGKEVEE